MRPGYAIDPDGPARGVSRGPHARPGGVPRGDARLAARAARWNRPRDPRRRRRRRRRDRGRRPRRGRACATCPTGRGAASTRRATPALREAAAPLIAFVDDDVLVPPGWLEALVEGAARHPDAEAFGGPIRARFEGPPPRGCGREEPPITTLDLGGSDREADFVWGANFAVRRGAIERVGPFDESIVRPARRRGGVAGAPARGGRADRLPGRAPGSTTAARPRTPACGRWRAPPTRAAAARGRATAGAGASRRCAGELRVLAGCGWHTAAARLPAGPDHGRALGRAGGGGAATAR